MNRFIATITRIREKPERERNRIALSLAGGMTLLIFVVWFSSFIVSVRAIGTVTPQAAAPLESFSSTVSSGFSSLSGSAQKTKDIILEAVPQDGTYPTTTSNSATIKAQNTTQN